MAEWRNLALAMPIAAVGGALAHAIHMPLAWVLGSMLAVAAASLLSGRTLAQPSNLRRMAQGCIGLAIGLAFTPQIWRVLGGLAPWVVLGALSALTLTVLAAPVIQRLARVDGATAIYCVALGASSEMVLQARQAGADGASVACAHAVRIILVTGCLTLLIWSIGPAAQAVPLAPQATTLPMAILLTLLPAAAIAALVLQKWKVPNPWLLGPLFTGGLASAASFGGRLPDGLLVMSQVLIGWALGQAITRQFFARAPRVIASSALVTLAILTVCLGLAWLVSLSADMPLATAFLAFAPGGMAEMAVMAKAFGLAAPMVTAFHIARIVCTILITRSMARWMLRVGWVRP
jgi:membrane AbrB-like protein